MNVDIHLIVHISHRIMYTSSFEQLAFQVLVYCGYGSLDLRMIGIMMADCCFQSFDMRSLWKGSAAANDSLFFGFLALESWHSLMTRSVVWQDLHNSISCLLAGQSDVPRQHEVYGKESWAKRFHSPCILYLVVPLHVPSFAKMLLLDDALKRHVQRECR